ncbi:helix-turn-helix domain-containing protein [Diaphorobacter caeni]|uniref:helix-turn-helix domain-containing protein n=1 Tax=Diaphorobacter caeni TaxID=2784387 RepID=UPI00188F2430|nr:AraC family transcriptional regulator [Diaphorobacter caeni]MBF5003891.1 helix-turn-helix transcriptional regulator [Diaphorobacter caeni]
MSIETSSVAIQGSFGRIAVHSTARALVEHSHLEFNFIFYIGGAPCGFQVAHEEYRLDETHAVLVNPWLPHRKLASDGERETQVLTVLPNTQWLGNALGMMDLPLLRLFQHPQMVLTEPLRLCLQRLAATLQAGAAQVEQHFEPLVLNLVREVVDTHVDQSMRANFHKAERPMDARVQKSLALIRAKARENPGLEWIASQVGLSRSRFFEQFKLCVGVPPQQYLDWARMAVATELLAQSDKSLAEVSDELGFAAPSHFARFFVQHMGVPPSDYRRGVIVEDE